MKSIRFFTVLCLLLTARAFATTYLVDPYGTGDFPTIQAAIDAASDGDVIELADGTFTGAGNRDIDYLGKAITVRSVSGDPTACVIDCEGSGADQHRGFYLHSAEGLGSVIEGMTIANGYHEVGGCGIRCEGTSPTVRKCILRDNTGCYWEGGAGMSCQESAPFLEDCHFLDNATSSYHVFEANGYGAGMLCHDSQPILVRCVFARNVVSHLFDTCGHGGAMACIDSEVTITDCEFYENEAYWGGMCSSHGPGIYAYNSNVGMSGCIFARNYGQAPGSAIFGRNGGSYILASCTFFGNVGLSSVVHSGYENTGIQVENTIFAFNTYDPIWGWMTSAPVAGNGEITLTSCDLFENACGDWIGEIADQLDLRGNFYANPCFCDTTSCDLHLCADSWCAPENHPWGWNRLVGALDIGCAACDCSGPVPAFLSSFEVWPVDGGVTVALEFSCTVDPARLRLVAEKDQAQWELSLSGQADNCFEVEDESPHLAGGGVVTYSLYRQGENHNWCLLASHEVTLPTPEAVTRLVTIHPNPFNPHTEVVFSVDRPQSVRVAVYDLSGALVTVLADGILSVGEHRVSWRGCDQEGREVAAGTYLVLLNGEDACETRKALLVR